MKQPPIRVEPRLLLAACERAAAAWWCAACTVCWCSGWVGLSYMLILLSDGICVGLAEFFIGTLPQHCHPCYSIAIRCNKLKTPRDLNAVPDVALVVSTLHGLTEL